MLIKATSTVRITITMIPYSYVQLAPLPSLPPKSPDFVCRWRRTEPQASSQRVICESSRADTQARYLDTVSLFHGVALGPGRGTQILLLALSRMPFDLGIFTSVRRKLELNTGFLSMMLWIVSYAISRNWLALYKVCHS